MLKALFRVIKVVGAGVLGAVTTGLISSEKSLKDNAVVAGSIGLGGLINGLAKFLREKNPDAVIWKYLKI